MLLIGELCCCAIFRSNNDTERLNERERTTLKNDIAARRVSSLKPIKIIIHSFIYVMCLYVYMGMGMPNVMNKTSKKSLIFFFVYRLPFFCRLLFFFFSAKTILFVRTSMNVSYA